MIVIADMGHPTVLVMRGVWPCSEYFSSINMNSEEVNNVDKSCYIMTCKVS